MSAAARHDRVPRLDDPALQPSIERLGQALARLLARRWLDHEAADAERERAAEPEPALPSGRAEGRR